MSNSNEQLAYNPNLIGEHMYAVTEIEERQPFMNAGEVLMRDHPILYKAGVLAVHGCMSVREDQPRKAVGFFDSARDELQGALEEGATHEETHSYQNLAAQLAMYRAWARPFVRKSRREQDVLEARANIKLQTVTSLEGLLQKRKKDLLKEGATAELTTLAILERQMHPWVISTLALPHHDQGAVAYRSKNRNFDILTVEAPPDGRVQQYRTQCKLGCLGLCQAVYTGLHFEAIDSRVRGRKHIARSEASIKEISGCCDLDLFNRNKLNYFNNASRLVVNEHRGTTSKHDIARLDALSNSVLLEVSLPQRIRSSDLSLTKRAVTAAHRNRQIAERKAAIEERKIVARERLAAADERRAVARNAITRMAAGPGRKAS